MRTIVRVVSTRRKRRTADALILDRALFKTVSRDQSVLIVDREIKSWAEREAAIGNYEFLPERDRIQRRIQNDRVDDRVVVDVTIVDIKKE